MENFKLGDRVKVLGKNAKGEVAYVGDTHFSDGVWLGISLDEPKGRNNGTVEGMRYFKCARNHGVFVRACQIEKECADNADGNDKTNNSASGRITYPNYLKSSSKMKCEKNLCFSKSDISKTKSQLKSINNCSSETFRASNIINKSSEMQAIKRENENLKKKLEETEKSLQETLEKYNKAMEEVKQMNEDLDSKKKQIKTQKFNMKLLKMRQCNHYKNINSFEISRKKSCKISNGDCIDELPSMVNDDSSLSDDEFDLQSMQTLSSMKRYVELEEQNRIMIEGLVELREFLQSQPQPQFIENTNTKTKQRRKIKNYRPLSKSNHSTAFEKNNCFPEEESDSKEYGYMFREMIKFTEIMKEKERLGKEWEAPNSISLHPSGDCLPTKREEMAIDNKDSQFRQYLMNQPGSDTNTQIYLDTSGIQTGTESLQSSLVPNRTGCQKYLQVAGDQRTEKSLNVPSKMKNKSYLNNIGDTMQSNKPKFEKELKQFMSSVEPNAGQTGQFNINTSFIQQKAIMVKVNDFASNCRSGKLESQLEAQIALPSLSDDISNRSK